MATRTLSAPRSLGREQVIIAGSFATNAGSNPVASSNEGPGWSVTRTAAGSYRVTLNAELKFQALVSAVVSLQESALAGQTAVMGPVNLSNRTFDIFVITTSTGAALDLAANANNRVNFIFVFRNTSQPPVRG